jgi:hypothetical protein
MLIYVCTVLVAQPSAEILCLCTFSALGCTDLPKIARTAAQIPRETEISAPIHVQYNSSNLECIRVQKEVQVQHNLKSAFCCTSSAKVHIKIFRYMHENNIESVESFQILEKDSICAIVRRHTIFIICNKTL